MAFLSFSSVDIQFLDGLAGGYGQALMPVAAVKLFGFTTPEWSQLVALMGLAGAGVALFAGPLIDKLGAKRMLVLTSVMVVLHAFLLARTQFLWEDTFYVRAMLALWVRMGPVTMVCALALAMSLCSSANSATQFAIYMSTANLGASVGSAHPKAPRSWWSRRAGAECGRSLFFWLACAAAAASTRFAASP